MRKNKRAWVEGRIIGRIWMPGIVCEKFVHQSIDTDSDHPDGPLREAMLRATMDGDFQSVGFDPDDAWLVVEHSTERKTSNGFNVGRATTKRVRRWAIRFGCWATDDMRASDADIAEANGFVE